MASLPPFDCFKIHIIHETDLKLTILYDLHDAPLSGSIGREKPFLILLGIFGGHTHIGKSPLTFYMRKEPAH